MRVGIRARLLAIVLVTSVVLLVVGVGGAAYVVQDSRESQKSTELAGRILVPAGAMIESFQEERLQSLRYLVGTPNAVAALSTARAHSDAAIAQVQVLLELRSQIDGDVSADELAGYQDLYKEFPRFRGAIDTRVATSQQVLDNFGKVIDRSVAAAMVAARISPDAEIAVELAYAVAPLRVAEAVSRATALGSMIVAEARVDERRITEFSDHVGEFKREATYAASVLRGDRLADLQRVTTGADWQLLVNLAADVRSSESITSADEAQWEAAADRVGSAMMKLWQVQSSDAHAAADARAAKVTTNSLSAGSAIVLVSILAFLVALAMANRVVARMKLLQRQTLELADHRLPELMRRLQAGERIDPEQEVGGHDFGTDEFGQVAAAFGRAHLVAVSAAVAEAETRAGVNAVFLNIAHRGQIVVHRQLALIDEAERTEENPQRLDLLFQLDHLATRARRNAENLIILGGARPGRRWRKPVPLVDVVRGAVAESLDYTRIRTGRLPEVHISGVAVADLIHALAELLDNATGFSPPQSQVSVSGAVVGRGIVIEIEDQGLGMSATELSEGNDLLANPPDFTVAALTDDIRLGLFVVAKLSAKHGISIRLRDSAYGGVQAVVLIPAGLFTDLDEGARGTASPLAESSPPSLAAGRVPSTTEVSRHLSSIQALPPTEQVEQQTDPRPPLPQRHRQTGAVQPVQEVEATPERSADRARDRIASVLDATRRGRRDSDR
ncbi:ATP-binding protein [Nocardia fluminea]|uniref:sensor histidine kinase n=1 Tax=Nocardia fluminea TaxID=134984 RepID=UPI00340D632C